MVHKDPEGYISDSGSSSSDADLDQDNDFGDWASDDSNPPTPTPALFLDPSTGARPSFKTPLLALDHARTLGCDLVSLVHRLSLDTLQTIRLINHIRRNSLTPAQANAITEKDACLNDDAELKPVQGYEDDGLLQVDFDLLSPSPNPTASGEQGRIAELEQQLSTARAAYDELRSIHAATLGLSGGDLQESSSSRLTPNQLSSIASQGRSKRGANDSEDDILYFDSYSTNSIHQTMITDTARTLSYAQFLLHPSNSHLIRGKVVMDVGCGTGILSLFAARAGAKTVIAIDASAIVERARENVEKNGFGHVIKVFRGKLEDLTEELKGYEGAVDMLVSEWMGYFLLYENMLPSVLVAKERYLKKEGVLGPNRMTMHLAAFSSARLLKEKIGFWEDVHGFDMSSMTTGLLDEAFVDVLPKEEVVSDSYVFADLNLPTLPAKQPEPSSEFELVLTSKPEGGMVNGFISWFDTFFFPSSTVPSDATVECPEFNLTEKDVRGLDLKKSQLAEEQEGKGEKGEMVCFSTSPYSKETHWQQTLFVLKEPITGVEKGDKIKGRIVVLQDQKHSRQLEVELHYLHVPAGRETGGAEGKKRVETMAVQVFMVR